jgi:hypothetical protein
MEADKSGFHHMHSEAHIVPYHIFPQMIRRMVYSTCIDHRKRIEDLLSSGGFRACALVTGEVLVVFDDGGRDGAYVMFDTPDMEREAHQIQRTEESRVRGEYIYLFTFNILTSRTLTSPAITIYTLQ